MRRWAAPCPHKLFSSKSQSLTRQKRRSQSFLAQKMPDQPNKAGSFSIPRDPLPKQKTLDPSSLVSSELTTIRKGLLGLLGSANPGLTEVAEYYFLHPSKQLRSLIVLLCSRATNGLGGGWDRKRWEAERERETGLSEELDRPLRQQDILNNWHPSMPNDTASFESVFDLRPPGQYAAPFGPPPLFSDEPSTSRAASPVSLLLPTQIRLAQISEMIHIASLLHDNVFDPSSSSSDATQHGSGNKLSILGGDFLLGRASAALSRLGENEVVELVAGVISNLVEGEILRMKDVNVPGLYGYEGPSTMQEAWNLYIKRAYLKTASLIAKSARASVILGGCREGELWKEIAYAYGRNIGIAHQLAEDVLEYESDESDIQSRLVTGPVLYAWEEHPELQGPIQRNLTEEGDAETAVAYVRRSSGIERTRLLAQVYANKAQDLLDMLPDSEAKAALDTLTANIVNRTW